MTEKGPVKLCHRMSVTLGVGISRSLGKNKCYIALYNDSLQNSVPVKKALETRACVPTPSCVFI